MFQTTMSENNVCALCLQEGVLRESHIIPKFVGKWMKETGTGYLTTAEDGSKRVQDTTKIRLLCDSCEEKFSKLEKYFADKIFFPFHNDKIRTFDYDKNLEAFIVSLSWRILKITGSDFRDKNPGFPLQSFVNDAEEYWREFLNGEKESVGRYENHVVFLDYVDDSQNPDVDPKFNWYTLRSTDFTIVTSSKRVLVYVKLPWMIFVTTIHPTSLDGWNGTVIKESGRIVPEQSITDGGFGQFLLERVRLALHSSPGPTPEVARKRLMGVMKKDPEKFLGSSTLRSMMVEGDLRRKGRMRNMPEAVVDLVDIIRTATDNPQLTLAENQQNAWMTRHIANKIANLSKEQADELHRMIAVAIEKSKTSKQAERCVLQTDSLWISFMITHGSTTEHQQANNAREIERLRQQADDKIPIAVFSLDSHRDTESAFFMPENG